MNQGSSKLNTLLSTLNFVLMFVGYQLATSLFLPLSSDIEGISRTVTVPYRAFALFISLLVIFLNFRKKIGKTPLAVKILWLYWFALILRIFYDTNVRIDVQVGETIQLWMYIFGIILPAMYSVMKSYRMIDFDKALKWIYWGTVLSLVLSLFNNATLLMDADEITGRTDGNVALNTISFGHLATTGVILSLFMLFREGKGLVKKTIFMAIMLISFFIMLRAGSRSPVLALMVVLLFWMFARGKNMILGFSIAIAVLALLIVFIDPILNFMGNISPVIEARLRASIYMGDSSGRDPIFEEAFQLFLDKPLLGSQFAFFTNSGGIVNSHNIILDALMGLGLFGGILIIYILWKAVKISYILIKHNHSGFWISLILIQQLVVSMLSGAIYSDQLINVLLVIILMYYSSNKLVLIQKSENLSNYKY